MNEKIIAFRKKVPVLDDGIYLNHAAVSPMTRIHLDAFNAFYEHRSRLPVEFWPDALKLKMEFKRHVKKLINAESPKNIAFSFNTSAGLNMIASGYPFREGDEILIPSIEFPANVYPYMLQERRGVKIRFVEISPETEITLDLIKKYVTDRTKAIAISYVQFINGYKADLKAIGEFCRDNDFVFIVDGIQGVGVAPIDVQAMHIDALAVGGHKWLMWPMGTGFLYLSSRILGKINPIIAGWLSVKDSWNFFDYKLDYLDDAGKFEYATLNYAGMYIANEILTHFLEIGIDQIFSRIIKLTDLFFEHLSDSKFKIITPKESRKRAGIVTIEVKNAEIIYEELKKQRIYLSLREGRLRIAPHFYNHEDEILEVIKQIKALA